MIPRLTSLLFQTSALARASPWKVDEDDFDYELEDEDAGMISFQGFGRHESGYGIHLRILC
jgi:hypothetical protein